MNSTGTNPKQGELYLIEVLFRDTNEYKIRPCVIVGNEQAIDIDVLSVPITGSKPRSAFDVVIEYWQEAGLNKPSVARTTKTFSIHKSKLRNKIGELHTHDLRRILETCKSMY